MSDYQIPEAAPTEKDAQLADQFQQMKSDVKLRGVPEGDQRCDNCEFMAEPTEDVSYCWHEKVDAPVGKQWWCDRWEAIGEADQEISKDQRATAMRMKFTLIEDQQWVAEPKFGEKCDTCLFYTEPGESVAYCWHPNIRVGVGHDHWCQWWEPQPGGEVGGPGDK